MDGIITPSKSDIMPPGTPHLKTPEPTLQEPSMVFPRPSSDRAQDVSHILAAVFKDLYTRDVMGKDMVKNLTTTSDGSSDFHKKCMKQLKDAHAEHKRRLHECSELERHIIHARARAVSSDERALSNAAGTVTVQEYEQLGLPNVKSNFKSCLNNDLMKANNLIALNDIFPKKDAHVESPRKHKNPHYSLPTLSSSTHVMKGPFDDGYTSLEEIALANAVHAKDDETITTLSSDSFELVSHRPTTKMKPKEKPPNKKHGWRGNMNQENRVEDRALLAKLEERHNFLKNPRFGSGANNAATNILGGDKMFVANPNTVRFSEWIVGRVYEAVLELKNVASISTQLRIVPPTSQFFSVTLGKYPGEGSIVASGMSVKFNIRFMPDSLADYEDVLTVIPSIGSPLVVELMGKRDAPILNLLPNINNGHCLVGGMKITELMIKNTGGSGRFCILKKSSWPAVNFKTVVSPSVLDIGQFQIRPAVFELLAGQTAIVEVLFSPMEPKKYKEDILMVCDNCQLKEFTLEGEGQLAAVEIVSVSEGGESEPVLGKCTDMTADHFIRFPPLNPHSFYMKQVIVHNSCNVDMPYEWHCLKPNLVAPLPKHERTIEGRFEFYPDESMSFFIEPRKGVLQANGIHEFVLSFAPGKVGAYHNVLHMVLSNIPEIKQDEEALEIEQNPSKQTLLRQESIPSNIKGANTSQSGNFNEAKAGKQPTASTSSFKSSSTVKSTSGSQLREVIALEIETKGQGMPYSVLFHPPAIVIPGEVLKGTTSKRPFRMANYSLAPVEFKWSNEMTPNIIEVEPSLGIIQPGDYLEMEVFVTGSSSGKIDSKLVCTIEHHDEPLALGVTAQIKGPTIVTDANSVSFGLVREGTTENKSITIRNTTQLHANWMLSERISSMSSESNISFSPSCGELLPLGNQEICITLNASASTTLDTVLDLLVQDGKTSFISVFAEIQTPEVCFLESDVVLKNSYLSVPQLYTSVMDNQTLFNTKFKFIELKGKQASICDVTVNPSEGIIGPHEKLNIQLTISCHHPGELKDAFLLCYIEGMRLPIVLAIYSIVQTLKVSYKTPGCPNDNLKLDFGNDVSIGVPVTKQIVLINETSIRAPWSAFMQNFPVFSYARPPFKTDFKTPRTRRMMLGRTPNLADPLARTKEQAKEDHANLILKSGKGVAFNVSPSKGFFEPYQSQVIDITTFTNMWGTYSDTLVCKVESLPKMEIPVEVETCGCPLVFQVVSGSKNKSAIVRFGSHITNGPEIQRKMRILNKSPCDMQIDWRTFDTSNISKSKQAVDLVMWFGKAFPKLDKQGHEIRKQLTLSKDNISSSSITGFGDAQTSSAQFKATELAKIVNVKIQPHLGEMSCEPFSIIPSQVVIPAHGHATVNAVFKPGSSITDSSLVTGFASGYMSVVKSIDKCNGNIMHRKDAYYVSPLRLEMTASLRYASLDFQLDSDEEDTSEDCDIEFQSSLGDLLQDGELCGDHSLQRNFTLKNTSEMALEFNASINEPFFMVNKSINNKTGESKIFKTARNNLIPQDNIRIKIGFSLSKHTLRVLDDLKLGKTVRGAQICSMPNKAEALVFNDVVAINYMNHTQQTIRVKSLVNLPKLQLSAREMNFGTCFVNQMESKEVKIYNSGKSSSTWSTEIHYSDSSVGTGVFQIEPEFGLLDGLVSNVSLNDTLVNISYTPLSNKECHAVILFKGKLGETTKSLSVIGGGSHDGIFSKTNE